MFRKFFEPKSSLRPHYLVRMFWLLAIWMLVATPLWAQAPGTWQPANDLHQARAGHTATLLANGEVLIAGGKDVSGQVLATAESYDPASGQYTPMTAQLPVPVWSHTATLLKDGKVLLVGGNDGSGQPISPAQLFDPSTGKFTALTPMSTARSGHTATLLSDGRVLIAGGTDGVSARAELEIYDPATRKFSLAPNSLLEPRQNHTTTVLPDGWVLIAGGSGASGVLNSAELYEPQGGYIIPAGSLTVARTQASAALLLDGTVLVAGGQGAQQQDLDSAEVFEPYIGSFIPLSARMITARHGHVGLILPHNGKVLIVGGASDGQPASTAEVYDPVRGEFWEVGSLEPARELLGTNFFSEAYAGILLISGGLGNDQHPLAASELFFYPTLRSDKPDYQPGDSVTLMGEGWRPNEAVTITIHESSGDPDTTVTAAADASGSFTRPEAYLVNPLDRGVKFLATAVGQTSNWMAQMVFTDSPLFTAGIDPTTASEGSPTTYTLTVTNLPSNNNGSDTACVRVAIPTGVTNVTSLSVLAKDPDGTSRTWSISASGSTIQTKNSATGGGANQHDIDPGGTIAIRFTATSSAATGTATKTWTTSAFRAADCSNPFEISGNQPSVTISAATTLKVASATGTYGGATTLSATLTSGSSGVGGKSISFTLNGTSVGTDTTNASGVATHSGVSLAGINAGTYTGAIVASFAGDSSYPASTGSGTLTVNKADQTISFTGAPASAVYNTSFAVSATASSGLPVTLGASGACALSGTTVTMTSGTGLCTLTAGQAGNANYNAASQVTQVTTAVKASQTISFAALGNKTYGDPPFPVSATASSGLSVSFSAAGNCSLSGSTVTITGAGSCSVTASQGGDANYNAAPNMTHTFTIAKAQATLTLANLSHTYDGSPKAATVTTSPGGLSLVSVTYDGSTTPPTNAGSYAVVAVLTNPNYEAPNATGTLIINKASQTISFAGLANKTFGDSAFTVSATGGGSGLPVSFSATGNCMVSGSTVTITGAGNCMITASQEGNANYNAAPDVAQTLSIAKADQTITFGLLSDKTYGNPPFTVSATTSSSLPVGFTAVGACSVSGTTVTLMGAGTCTITASQGGDANYNAAANVSWSFSIAKATPTVNVSGGTFTYDGNPHAATAMATGIGGVNVDGSFVFTYTPPGDATTPVNAGTYAVSASFTSSDPNYTDATGSGSLIINKAPATLSLNNLTQTYDGTPKAVTVATTPQDLSGVATTYDGLATPPINAGSYAVVAVLTNPNYQAPKATGTLVINKASQTISFAALSNKTYGDPAFNVSATASSGLPVSLSAAGSCTVVDNLVTITGAGSCTMTAAQAGNTNYNPAPNVAQSFAIAKAQATLTLGDLTHTYDGNPKAATVTTSPAGLSGVTLTYNGSPSAPTNAGSYAVVAALDNPNYQAQNATGTLVIHKADQAISVAPGAPATAVYNTTFTVAASASSSLPVSISATGVCSLNNGTVTMTSGTGICTVTFAQPGDANYNAASQVSQATAAAKAVQTISFTGALASAVYSTSFAVSATASSGLPVTLGASGACALSGTTVTMTSGTGLCTLTADQAGDANYNAAPQAPQVTAAQKADQTVSFGPLPDKQLGDDSFTVSATGGGSGNPVIFGASPSSVCGAGGTNGSTITLYGVGTCTVTASQAGNENYNPAASVSRSFKVSYAFTGFFRPVESLPTLNLAKAGSAIPVKFSLHGYWGLNILAAGSPTSGSVACDSTATVDVVDQTVTAGSSSLSYDPTADQYVYVWKTDKSWTGCRQLQVKLNDGTTHWAMFKFTK